MLEEWQDSGDFLALLLIIANLGMSSSEPELV